MLTDFMENLARTMVQKKDDLIISKLVEFAGEDWDINKVNCLIDNRVEIFQYNNESFLVIYPMQTTMVDNRLEGTFQYKYIGDYDENNN